MAMTNSHDLEALSAYLDQALEPRDRTRLEDRLKRDPQLQAELESLRRTRQLLRAAPQMRAPRSFALTPEMVGAPARSRLYPVTRLAFALASVLFAVGLVGNYAFTPVTAPGADSLALADNAEIMESQPLEESLSIESAAAITETVESLSVEAGPAEGETTIADSAPAPEEGSPAGGSPEELQALAPPTEEAQAMIAEEPAAAAEEAASSRSAPTEMPAAKDAAADAGLTENGAAGPTSPWFVLAIASGSAAALSGILMLVQRRR